MELPNFEFITSSSIQFGQGKLAEVPGLLQKFGVHKPFIVNDGRPGGDKPLTSLLDQASVAYTTFSVLKEPSTESVEEAIALSASSDCDGVISIGGGSVIDTGKAVSALLTNGGRPIDYMEVIGEGKPMTLPAQPFIAIPTTAGTGAEVSKNAVLASIEHAQKVSLRSEYMLPKVALIDPELTVGVPPHITATCGLDALCHCLEAYCTHLNTPITDSIAREGMLRAARSMLRTFTHGDDINARSDMALTSLFGGIALANAKLGSVHGFAGVLGGMFEGSPHGGVVAACMPTAIRVNVRALRSRSPDHDSLRRYTEVAQMLTGRVDATAEDGAQWLTDMLAAMDVPGLSHWGVTESDAAPGSELIQKAQGSSSMKGNPIALTDEEAAELVRLSLPQAGTVPALAHTNKQSKL
eukprot:SAG31_NODE_4678_length_3040_cov_3.101666_1_plen_411_part_00